MAFNPGMLNIRNVLKVLTLVLLLAVIYSIVTELDLNLAESLQANLKATPLKRFLNKTAAAEKTCRPCDKKVVHETAATEKTCPPCEKTCPPCDKKLANESAATVKTCPPCEKKLANETAATEKTFPPCEKTCPPCEKTCPPCEKKFANETAATERTCPTCVTCPTAPPPKKVDGIARSEAEQNKESIEILSLALENAAAKHRRLTGLESECDWTDGSWVNDSTIEYGKGILAGYPTCHVDYRQNCKKNQNDAPYLGYRWVLKNETCEAKRIRFTRERFLQTVQNKSILFIGDSLTRNMFQSLACLLYSPNNKTQMIEDQTYRYRYPEFNVTVEFIVSNYLVKENSAGCDSDATVKLAKAPCLDLQNVDSKWTSRVGEFGILLFATGGWWEHDLQMRQVTGGDPTYRSSRGILRQGLQTVVEYLSRPEFSNKQIFWRCSEVSHFFGGEWNSGGTCRRDAPSKVPLYNAVSLFIQEAVIDTLATSPAKIGLLDITKISGYRQDAHPSSQSKIGGRTDCKHWCLPGVPDHWNEIWLNMLLENVSRTR